MKKFLTVLTTTILFLFLFSLTVFGAGNSKANATAMQIDTPYQSNLSLFETEWYKITADETQYYRFNVLNQSIEIRTGIGSGLFDDFINFFVGHLTVTVRDQNDMTLAQYSIRAGYEGRIAIKFEKGQTYYIFVNSTVTGNYRITPNKLADIGADSWDKATETISNAQIISAVDATSDSDWFTFKAEAERAYYTFSLENISGNSSMNIKLYQYVPGAGEFPLREVRSISVNSKATKSFDLQLEENGKYYYRIFGDGSCTGGYQLDVGMRLDAAGASFGEAYPIDVGEEYITSFDGTDDYDYYVFTASEDQAYYHFYLDNIDGRSRDFILYDEGGVQLLSGHSSYYEMTKDIKLAPGKTYYILYKGSNSNYKFKITEKKDAYSDEMKDAEEISLNKEYVTSFDGTDDKDYVKFKASVDQAYYHIYVENTDDRSRDFILYDEGGVQLLSGHSSYYEMTKDIKLAPGKTYYILFKGSNSNYKFKVTEKKDAYSDEMKDAKAVLFNKQIISSFEGEGDKDYVKFKTLSSQAYYHIYMDNLSGYDRDFYVYDEEGFEVCYGHSDYYEMTKDVKLQPDKTYYLLFLGDNSDYKFKISYTVDDDYDEKENSTLINLNTPEESRLEASNDTDWFYIQINSPGKYRLRCNSLSGTRLYYSVYNSYDGSVDMGDYSTYLEPGTYYIEITGKEGYYSLTFADCGSGHKENTLYVLKSTTSQSGVKKTECKSCKKVIKTETVAQIKSISLSSTSLVYDGETNRPKVMVTDDKGEKITSFSLVWSDAGSTLPGEYKVTINFNGAYSGSKSLTYSIKPSQVKKLKASSVKTTSIKLSWSKIKGDVQYEVYYSTNGKKWTKATTTKNNYYTLKKLKSGTVYRYRVRAVTVTGSLKGSYSAVLTSATNPVKVTLSKLTAGSKQMTATWKTVSGATGYEVVYSTSKKFTQKTTKTVTIKKAKTKKTTIKKLKKGKKYYVKVRAYKTVSGKKIYGAYSSVKNVKVK